MNIDVNVLDAGERVIYALRSLYMAKGYRRYRMSKFEEYDFYSRNKSFLVSEDVITFTDTNGRLMALKPDVTLSIIKNTRDGEGTQRLCYNENVYRVSGSTRAFREITQTGVECIGNVGTAEISEVLSLSAGSLEAIGKPYILEISDLDVLSGFISDLGLGKEESDEVLRLSAEKNLHGIQSECKKGGVDEKAVKALTELLAISLPPDAALERLERLCSESGCPERIRALRDVLGAMDDQDVKQHMRVDFSLYGNPRYYNGIVFKGYVEGVYESVLSGGRYDALMQRLGRKASAIGFAVYLDRLERLDMGKAGASAC